MAVNTQILTIKNTSVRVTYEGCDVVRMKTPPDHAKIATLLTTANVAYILCGEGDNRQIFYINKSKHHMEELDVQPEFLNTFQERCCGETPYNQPKSLCSDDLAWLRDNGLATRGSERIKNIECLLTPSRRESLLRKLYDKKMTASNAAYTYVFQGYLAKYEAEVTHELASLDDEIRHYPTKKDAIEDEKKKITAMQSWMHDLHALSAQYIPLERLINTQPASVDVLLEAMKDYRRHMNRIIKGILIKYPREHYPEIYDLVSALGQNLTKGRRAFKAQIKRIKDADVLTQEHVHPVFCSQTRDLNIKALGTFMAEQMVMVLDTGIQVGYEISDNRFLDGIHLPLSLAALSDAKAHISSAFSLNEAEYKDTYSPIPEGMLASLTSENASDSADEKWFSIKPYVKDWNPVDVDKVLCLATNQTLSRKQTASFLSVLGKIGAGFFEVLFVFPLRLVITLALALVDVVGSIFYTKKSEEKWTNYLNQQLASWHEQFSVVSAAKRLCNQQYRRLTAEGEVVDDGDPHQALLDQCTDDSNLFHAMLAYLSPQRVADTIKDFFMSLARSIIKFPNDFMYLLSSSLFGYSDTARDVYKTVKTRYALTKWYQQKLEDKVRARALLDDPEASSDLDQYPMVDYCSVNEIASPVEIFREIMVTLSDTVIDPMFRKSPGPATVYFMLSMVTFATYLAPAGALAWMKSAPAWLQKPTDILSIHLTGKATSLGAQEQMVACFLEWKLNFFTTELLIEIQHGNFEFFHEMVKEPEQLSMGLIGLIGMGMAMQYLPLLPTTIAIPGFPVVHNYYAEVVNVFIDEAKGCADGTPGLTGLEYGFLGLKFAMLMHSMLLGTVEGEHATDFHKLAEACQDKQFLKALLRACQEEQVLDETDPSLLKAKVNTIMQRLLHAPAEPTSFWDNIFSSPSNVPLFTSAFTHDALEAFSEAFTEQIVPALKDYTDFKQQEDDTDKAMAQELKQIVEKQANPKSLVEKETSLGRAHRALLDAINMVRDKKVPLIFSNNRLKEANKFYDHLDRLFDKYNEKLRKIGREKQCIDKRPMLDVFYNKHCYQGSNNLLRSLLFFPLPPFFLPLFYVAAVLFRFIKLGLAYALNKPSMIHQVWKSFNKDLVIMFQVLAIVARVMRAFVRSISDSLRVIIGIPVFIMAAVVFPFYYVTAHLVVAIQQACHQTASVIVSGKSWFKKVDAFISGIALHRIPLPFHASVRAIYASAARVAGSNSDVIGIGDMVVKTLEVAAQNPDLKIQKEAHVLGLGDSVPTVSHETAAVKKSRLADSSETSQNPSTLFHRRKAGKKPDELSVAANDALILIQDSMKIE